MHHTIKAQEEAPKVQPFRDCTTEAEEKAALAQCSKWHVELFESYISDFRRTEASVDALETKAGGKPPRPLAVSAGVETSFDLFFSERRRRNADVARLYLHIEDQAADDWIGRWEPGTYERISAMKPAFARIQSDVLKYEDMVKKINVQMLVFSKISTSNHRG